MSVSRYRCVPTYRTTIHGCRTCSGTPLNRKLQLRFTSSYHSSRSAARVFSSSFCVPSTLRCAQNKLTRRWLFRPVGPCVLRLLRVIICSWRACVESTSGFEFDKIAAEALFFRTQTEVLISFMRQINLVKGLLCQCVFCGCRGTLDHNATFCLVNS